MKDITHNPQFSRLFTAAQTQQFDSRTIEDFGIDGFTLMELAASGAAGRISQLHGKRNIGLYLCGKGNNAGDAIAVARYLVNQLDHKIKLFFLYGDDPLSTDSQKNLDLLMKCEAGGVEIFRIQSIDEIMPGQIDYIVDGLLGTGLKGDLRSPISDLVNKVNSFNIPVYSMDIPTGLNADTGKPHGTALRATETITFGTNKLGFYLNRAERYTGRIEYIPLPIPNHLYEQESATLILAAHSDSLPSVQREAEYKYDGGVVHIVAGSEGLTGAAILAAKSAWKQGAGAVLLYTPHSLLPIYELNLPTVIKVPLGGKSDLFFKNKHSDSILQKLKEKPGTMLIGPGIGKKPETGELIKSLLENHDGFSVIDADALSFFDHYNSISKSKRLRWILTPHIGEAKNYLTGNFSNDSERLDWAQSFADTNDTTLLLKGDPVFVAQPNKPPLISGYRTNMFNRAGFGDVLAGSIATKLSITEDIQSAVISSMLHGYHTYQKFYSSKPFGPEDLL